MAQLKERIGYTLHTKLEQLQEIRYAPLSQFESLRHKHLDIRVEGPLLSASYNGHILGFIHHSRADELIPLIKSKQVWVIQAKVKDANTYGSSRVISVILDLGHKDEVSFDKDGKVHVEGSVCRACQAVKPEMMPYYRNGVRHRRSVCRPCYNAQMQASRIKKKQEEMEVPLSTPVATVSRSEALLFVLDQNDQLKAKNTAQESQIRTLTTKLNETQAELDRVRAEYKALTLQAKQDRIEDAALLKRLQDMGYAA